LAVDLNSPEGRAVAERLIASSDVVVENYSPRVFESWGLLWPQIAAINPRVILLRMPAFGLTGPWRDRVGYAQTMEQVSGLAWITGHTAAEPEMPNGPCDAVAGGHALVALLLALRARERTGRGMMVESPMIGSALNIAAEQVIEYSANGRLLSRVGNRSRTGAPQGAYLTASVAPSGRRDRWVVIAVEDDSHWERCANLVAPQLLPRGDLATVEGRRSAHDELDEVISAWCATREVDEIVAAFVSAGVPAAPVLLPHEQLDLTPLRERGFFEPVEHPVTGPATHSTFCARFDRGPARWHRRPSPTIGQHTREILIELRFDRAEIESLIERGVVADSGEATQQAW
jgi:crotonobetainyl-CoA:carnitine CoA-transferase CaiB-like acyl-CoA transferase